MNDSPTRPAPAPADTKPTTVHVVLRREHDRWAAIAVDYTIVGQGATEDEAIDQVITGVLTYFQWGREDGKSLDELRRPINLRWRVEIALGRQVSKLRRALRMPGLVSDAYPGLSGDVPLAC